VRVEITVSPSSRKFFLYIKNGGIHADLKNTPENNKANLELIKELKRATGAEVRIVSGLKSKRKVVEIYLDELHWNIFVNGLDGSD